MKRLAIALAIAILPTGCAAPTLDTTDETTTKESMQRIRDSLSEEDEKRLEEAMQVVTFSSLDFAAAMRGEELDQMAALKDLNGRTAEEIIAEADRITVERERKQREQALKELTELEEKKSKADAARTELAKFEVQESRFSIRKTQFSLDPAIRLKVHNGTEHPVSRAYFQGTLATPGRAVPWLKEDFNYRISGGLEPGETATWNLDPGYGGGWRQVEERADMVFTVEVVRLDGADDEFLYDATFSDEDQARLEALKEQYGGELAIGESEPDGQTPASAETRLVLPPIPDTVGLLDVLPLGALETRHAGPRISGWRVIIDRDRELCTKAPDHVHRRRQGCSAVSGLPHRTAC